MKYTISEFSKLLGITADTLRFYEKYEIIKPVKNRNNNYRYFDDLDARNILMSRWYKSLGFSVQEVAQLIKEENFAHIAERIRLKQIELEEEIRWKTMLLQKVSGITENLNDIEKRLNQCTIKKLSGIYRIRQTDKNELVQDGRLTGKIEEWMKYMPHTFFSFRIYCKEILSGNNFFNYDWGLALYIKDLNLEVDERIEYIEPKIYISSVITSSGDYITKESLQFMLDYIEGEQYTICGDVFGKIILTKKSKDARQSFLEVNIPVNGLR
mgnify:FL=1